MSEIARRCRRPGCRAPIQPAVGTSRQLYCSPNCRQAAFHGRPLVRLVARACASCGKRFKPDRSVARFCSAECRWRAANDARQRTKAPAPRTASRGKTGGRSAPGGRGARRRA